MKILFTILSLLTVVGGITAGPAHAEHYSSGNFDALTGATGFPSPTVSNGLSDIVPGFRPHEIGRPPPVSGQCNGAGLVGAGQSPYGQFAAPMPGTGFGAPPMTPQTMTGGMAGNSVNGAPISSGQQFPGIQSASGGGGGGGGGGQRNFSSSYSRRLPTTSTSSVDFDIVER